MEIRYRKEIVYFAPEIYILGTIKSSIEIYSTRSNIYSQPQYFSVNTIGGTYCMQYFAVILVAAPPFS